MSRLDRKLLRDLARLWPQLLAAVLVLGAGLSTLVMAGGLIVALETARDGFYQNQRMADVSASAVRAPLSLAETLADIPGVAAVEPRVSGFAALTLPGREGAYSARVLSLPPRGRPAVNDLALRQGRWPEPGRLTEALISSAFAEANGLSPGDTLVALIRGSREQLTIVGVADSPEFIFFAPPGELFPQMDRFAILWIGREGLARALDLDGAFNDAALRLTPDARPAAVIAAIDAVLAPYGGQGAIGREHMLSDRFIREELMQLRTMAATLPLAFLLVAAFLVNVTLSRLVATERATIGLLKSFGFSSSTIGWHYGKLALAVALCGALAAVAGGMLLGQALGELYQDVYRFPVFAYAPTLPDMLWTVATAVGACLLGAAHAVSQAARLAPAVALAPPAPVSFRAAGPVDRLLGRMDPRSRIVARRILRFPRRAGATVVGIALALALLVMAATFPASMAQLLRVNFEEVNRQSVTFTFAEARGLGVLHDLAALPGVMTAEPVRMREAVFLFEGRREREGLIGLVETPTLNRLLDADLQPLAVRGDGLTLSRRLAEKLGARAGDVVRVETTDGRRLARNLRVVSIADTWVGGAAYMEINALARAFGEAPRASAAHALLDLSARPALDAAVREIPAIVSASYAGDARASQTALFEQGVGMMATMFRVFAGLMAVGVAFSAARVTLAEQARDLATLRVLGFTRTECSLVLLAEMAILSLLAVPLGLVLGRLLAGALMRAFETDFFTLKLVIDPAAYAGAVAFVMVCAALATLFVRRGVDALSMTETLKARS
ncbi:ABC transporter permease [Phenylobacterium sp.]|uniref:ABC transporter permease n=1 Tax=Phenylobacterium sp. TaxID=1871053 RepID=UPI002FDA4840